MLGQQHISGHELSRLNVLAAMVCGILLKKSSRLPEIAAANCRDIQQPSKEKQLKRWLLSKHTSYHYHYLPSASSPEKWRLTPCFTIEYIGLTDATLADSP